MFRPSRISSLFAIVAMGALTVTFPRSASAFGDVGAFDARTLLTGASRAASFPTAAEQWAIELIARTSAPAKRPPSIVRASDASLLHDSFAVWSGKTAIEALTQAEIANLRSFLALGGFLVVDDNGVAQDGTEGPFSQSVKKELSRVLPDAAPIVLGTEHLLFRTFYLLKRAEGRVLGRPQLSAIVSGTSVRVVFLANDLGGALARGSTGIYDETVLPGGEPQRERAIRLAVNLSMYSLCSNYKDDQVHAPFLMRRRGSGTIPPR